MPGRQKVATAKRSRRAQEGRLASRRGRSGVGRNEGAPKEEESAPRDGRRGGGGWRRGGRGHACVAMNAKAARRTRRPRRFGYATCHGLRRIDRTRTGNGDPGPLIRVQTFTAPISTDDCRLELVGV